MTLFYLSFLFFVPFCVRKIIIIAFKDDYCGCGFVFISLKQQNNSINMVIHSLYQYICTHMIYSGNYITKKIFKKQSKFMLVLNTCVTLCHIDLLLRLVIIKITGKRKTLRKVYIGLSLQGRG